MGKEQLNLKLRLMLTFFILLTLAFPSQAYEKAKGLSIVDGDTVKVIYHKKEEGIRLIGIDAPERWPNKKAVKDAQRAKSDIEIITFHGKEAKGFVNA